MSQQLPSRPTLHKHCLTTTLTLLLIWLLPACDLPSFYPPSPSKPAPLPQACLPNPLPTNPPALDLPPLHSLSFTSPQEGWLVGSTPATNLIHYQNGHLTFLPQASSLGDEFCCPDALPYCWAGWWTRWRPGPLPQWLLAMGLQATFYDGYT